MPTGTPLYPGAFPTVTGNKITVERFVKNPTQVYRTLSDLTKERFVADFIFAGGPADGGAVIYDEISENDLYADRDPQEIAPGDEWPMVGDSQGDPKVAKVTKRGAAFPLTYDSVRRDARDVLNRGLIKLRNTSVRKHDTVAMQALLTNPTVRTAAATAPWSDPGADAPADLFGAQFGVEQADLGYQVDTAIANPAEVLKLLNDTDIRSQLPRESAAQNPLLSGRLTGLAGINNWIVTNRMTAGTVVLLQRQVAGSVRDEVPFYTRVVNQEERERYLIMAGRISVPIVTDPLAVFKITGC